VHDFENDCAASAFVIDIEIETSPEACGPKSQFGMRRQGSYTFQKSPPMERLLVDAILFSAQKLFQ
jgi:hypothetical protein